MPDYEGPLFSLGRLVITRAAHDVLGSQDVTTALMRHCCGDWGDVSDADKDRNDEAVKDDEQIHSVYAAEEGVCFWVITERDRSVTTVLLPDDY